MWRKISSRVTCLKKETRTLRRSISCAIFGIAFSQKTQKSFRIQLFISFFVTASFFFLDYSLLEISIVIISMSSVLCAELLNTSIELLCDLFSTNKNVKIKIIKDISAAAVLVTAVSSLFVGCILIIPKIVYILL